MSVDAELFVNAQVEVEEIMDCIRAKLNLKVTFVPTHTPSYVILKLEGRGYEGRHVNVHLGGARTANFQGILLTMNSTDASRKLMRAVGEVFGGFYQDQDVDSEFEQISGTMQQSNGLPYFLRYYLIRGGDPTDLGKLAETIRTWEREIKATSSIKGLPPVDLSVAKGAK